MYVNFVFSYERFVMLLDVGVSAKKLELNIRGFCFFRNTKPHTVQFLARRRSGLPKLLSVAAARQPPYTAEAQATPLAAHAAHPLQEGPQQTPQPGAEKSVAPLPKGFISAGETTQCSRLPCRHTFTIHVL